MCKLCEGTGVVEVKKLVPDFCACSDGDQERAASEDESWVRNKPPSVVIQLLRNALRLYREENSALQSRNINLQSEIEYLERHVAKLTLGVARMDRGG